MFISSASLSKGIVVSEGTDSLEPIRVQFGKGVDGFAVYFSREEALDLYSQLEKAIHQTAK